MRITKGKIEVRKIFIRKNNKNINIFLISQLEFLPFLFLFLTIRSF